MKRLFIFITLFLLCVMVSSGQTAEKRLVIGTASTGGTWYPLGGGVATIVTKYIKGVSATAIPSGASIENIRAIGKNTQDIALTMPDVAYFAYNGLEMFKTERYEEIRGLFATYPIDIHNPEGTGTLLRRLPPGESYDIPMRCLLPQDIEGLVLAGRCISGTHEAHSSYRVMPVSMATGQAAGVCASLAAKSGKLPREISTSEVQAELVEKNLDLIIANDVQKLI